MHLSERVAKRDHNVAGREGPYDDSDGRCTIIEACKNVSNFLFIVQQDPAVGAIATVELYIGHLHLVIGSNGCEGGC